MTVSAAPPISVHGHRGARALRPENTLPAFEYAIDQGVDVLELDMGVTKDDVVVVSHDSVLHAPICTGPAGAETAIRKMTLAQLRQFVCGAKPNPDFPKQVAVPGTRVPTLDEVFELIEKKKSRVHVNIETKISPRSPELAPSPEEFARLVLAVIKKHKMEQRTILQSFDFRTLHAMKKLAPESRRSALFPFNITDVLNTDFVAIAAKAQATIVSPHLSVVTPERVAKAHQAGLTVVPWTANTPGDWDKLIKAKVDAIISDDPAALIAYLKEKGLR